MTPERRATSKALADLNAALEQIPASEEKLVLVDAIFDYAKAVNSEAFAVCKSLADKATA